MNHNQKMMFAESCLPLLQSGEYELTAWEEGKALGKSQVETRKIQIQGPRFSLNPDEILGVSPGQGLNGNFETILPQVMLKRKTLPWERQIRPSALTSVRKDNTARKEKPWLYVFLLAGNEIVPVQTGKTGDVILPSKGTFFPPLTLEEREEELIISYVDVDAGIFREIFPEKEEICYLAHARKKGERKGNARRMHKSAETEEWYSVVLGNRLPQSTEQGVLNQVYLVSVEGFDSWWENDNSSYEKVRMVVLYHWQFISVKQKYHWKEMFADLDVGGMRMEESSNYSEGLNELLHHGYVPVPHILRDGSRTVSFYRGPFSPVRIKREEHPVYDSDSLYRYDPVNGVFDVSLSCAWQQGRLLALANPSFIKRLQKNRSLNLKLDRKKAEKTMIASRLSHVSGQDSLEEKTLEQLNCLWEETK